MDISLLKPYIGKEITLRLRGFNLSNAFLAEVNEPLIVMITNNQVSKTPIIHFIDVENVTSFSVSETILDESHAGYIEKYNIRQTFK